MKKWQLKEKEDAKAFGGKRVRASGSKWYAPGDVKDEDFLYDSKQTDKKSYSLNIDTLDKLYEEALFSFRIPALSVKIRETEVVVLFKEDFEKLKNKKEPTNKG